MRILKTNTAVRVCVGPFLDKTDGVTPEVALTVTSCTCELTHEHDDNSGVTRAALSLTVSGGSNDMVHVTDDVGGMYDLELTAANVNFLGRARLCITDAATHLPVFEDVLVVPANVYDSLVGGTDNLTVDTAELSGTAATAITAIDDFLDTEIAAIKAKTDNLPSDPADESLIEAAITAATSPLSTAAALAIVAGYIDTEVAAIKAKTDNLPAAPAAVGDMVSAATIADAVLDEVLSGHSGAGSLGKVVTDNLNAPVGTVDTVVDSIKTVVDNIHDTDLPAVKTDTAAIKLKTDNLPSDPADQSAVEAAITAATSPLATASALSTVAGYVDTEVASILAAVDTEVAAIKAKTDNLPADPASETNVNANETKIDAIDTVVDAIKVATDKLNFTGTDVKATLDGETVTPGADSITASTIAADVTTELQAGLATAANLATVDGIVDAIKLKTDLIPASPAATGDIPTAGAIADAVLDEAAGAHTGVIPAALDATISSRMAAASYTAPDNAGIAAVKAKTDNLPSDPADASDVALVVAGAVTSIVGAEGDTLATLSAQIDTAQADLDNPSQYKADVSGVATAVALAAVEGKIDTLDTVADAIKLKTDNLPADPADQSALEAAVSATEAAIRGTDSDTLKTIADQLDTIASEGSGSKANVITVTKGGLPVENVQVWVSTDAAGSNIIAGTLNTSSLGTVTFMLDVGVTYYVWAQKDGVNFTNPTTYVGV